MVTKVENIEANKKILCINNTKRAKTESDAVRNSCAHGGEKCCGCVRVGVRRLLE